MTSKLSTDPESKFTGLVTCDLVCWGVASPTLFSEYLEWLGKVFGSQVVGFWHRAKSQAWDGTRPMALLEDGRRVCGYEVDLWQRLWPGKLCRPSCYSCEFHSTERPGDLTIGDYWGLSDVHPDLSAAGGVSCLIANTRLGFNLVNACGDDLRLMPSELRFCANSKQPMLQSPPDPDCDKNLFWSEFYSSGFFSAAIAVGAIKRPSHFAAVKKAGKRAVKLLFPDVGVANECSQVTASDAGWESSEKSVAGRIDSADGYPFVFAAKNSSSEVRNRSSSGGMFHALASAVINQGGVVYGCAFDEQLTARHIRCETICDIERCMGSKYSQSHMGNVIMEINSDLREGRLVLFTGTPCEVSAVRRICGNTTKHGDLISDS